MKMLAALIAGLLLSMTTFVAGLLIAVSFFNAGEPDHVLEGKQTAALWSSTPVKIDPAAQDFERLPARVVPKAQTVAALKQDPNGAKAALKPTPSEARQDEDPDIDPVITGAIDRASETDREQDSWRTSAHVDWCSHRYRSYDAETNTYRPYGGGRRDCESPFSDVAAIAPTEDGTAPDHDTAWQQQSAIDPEQAGMQQAAYSESTNILSDADHIQSCMDRYRSYRPADNSYQPFDGGPRRQCE